MLMLPVFPLQDSSGYCKMRLGSVGKVSRHEIEEELGHGVRTTIYRAYDPRLKRDVVIKVLPREFLHEPQFRGRFEQEAQAPTSLERCQQAVPRL